MNCLETFATLRVFTESLDSEAVEKILGIAATRTRARDERSAMHGQRESHFWSWSTEGLVESLDGLDHIQAITTTFANKRAQLDDLRARGCEIDICCYWVSSGQGGPNLDAAALEALNRLGLEIWWDVYFGKKSEYAVGSAGAGARDA